MVRIKQNRRVALFSLWLFDQTEAGKKNENMYLMKRKIIFRQPKDNQICQYFIILDQGDHSDRRASSQKQFNETTIYLSHAVGIIYLFWYWSYRFQKQYATLKLKNIEICFLTSFSFNAIISDRRIEACRFRTGQSIRYSSQMFFCRGKKVKNWFFNLE